MISDLRFRRARADCRWMRSTSVVSKLLIFGIWLLVTLHAVQRILRMTLAVAEQNVTVLRLGSALDQLGNHHLPPREVLLARWTLVGPLTCVWNLLTALERSSTTTYAIVRASLHAPARQSVSVF
jgi:hypothetical protein